MIDYIKSVKAALDITWDLTEAETFKLSGECRRAEGYLAKRAGISIQFSEDMEDQALLQLLLDCIRYIHCDALDEFAKNYEEDLQMLRMNAQAQEVADETT